MINGSWSQHTWRSLNMYIRLLLLFVCTIPHEFSVFFCIGFSSFSSTGIVLDQPVIDSSWNYGEILNTLWRYISRCTFLPLCLFWSASTFVMSWVAFLPVMNWYNVFVGLLFPSQEQSMLFVQVHGVITSTIASHYSYYGSSPLCCSISWMSARGPHWGGGGGRPWCRNH
jgi:hypothetical protein